MPTVVAAKFVSLDGIDLVGDLVLPDQETRIGVVQVHGGGVTRHEAGFFDRMGDGLAAAGAAALRFDLRGHGESGGRQEDLTISGVLNDIRSAVAYLRQVTGVERVGLMGQRAISALLHHL